MLTIQTTQQHTTLYTGRAHREEKVESASPPKTSSAAESHPPSTTKPPVPPVQQSGAPEAEVKILARQSDHAWLRPGRGCSDLLAPPPSRPRLPLPRPARPARRPHSRGLCACVRDISSDAMSDARAWTQRRAARRSAACAARRCRGRDASRARADAPHDARCRGLMSYDSAAISAESYDSMGSDSRR